MSIKELSSRYSLSNSQYKPFGTGELAVVQFVRYTPFFDTQKRGILNFARCGRFDGLLSISAVVVTTEPFAPKLSAVLSNLHQFPKA